jgi:hypothetical protein
MPISTYEDLHKTLFPLPIPESAPRDDIGDLHYMNLSETLTMPFANEYQPSKIARAIVATVNKNALAASNSSSNIGRGRGRGRGGGTRRGSAARSGAKDPIFFQSLKFVTQTVKKNNFSMGHINRLRGVVNCMDCQKPRCIYSMQAIAKMKPSREHTKEEGID